MPSPQQLLPFSGGHRQETAPFRRQLLKWVGNKQRFAHEIVAYFPPRFERYYEPFLGSGAVLGTLAPSSAVGSDAFPPLMEIWHALKCDASKLKRWYATRWQGLQTAPKETVYEEIKAADELTSGSGDADTQTSCAATIARSCSAQNAAT